MKEQVHSAARRARIAEVTAVAGCPRVLGAGLILEQRVVEVPGEAVVHELIRLDERDAFLHRRVVQDLERLS